MRAPELISKAKASSEPTRRDRSNIAVARFLDIPRRIAQERVPTTSNVGSRDVTWASQPQPLIPFRVFSRVSRAHSLDTGQLGRERLTLASDWDEYQILVLKSSSNSSSIFCCTRATARRQKRAQRLAEPKNDHREKPVSARYRRSSRESEASKRNKGPSGSHLSPFAGSSCRR